VWCCDTDSTATMIVARDACASTAYLHADTVHLLRNDAVLIATALVVALALRHMNTIFILQSAHSGFQSYDFRR